MRTPEEQAALIREQVIAKIRWGSQREEVAQWLLEKHNVVGEDAEQMLDRGFRARRKAIRDRAFIRIAISFAGLALAGAFLFVRFLGGLVFYGTVPLIGTIIAAIIGLASVATLIRNVLQVLAGDVPGSID